MTSAAAARAARRQGRPEPPRVRASAPRPLGQGGGRRQADRGRPAERLRACAARGAQVRVALHPRGRDRTGRTGLPRRSPALGHEHGRARARALRRVRGPQRERPQPLPPLRAEEHRPGPGGRAAEPGSVRAVQAALRQPPDRRAARRARHDDAAPGHLGLPGRRGPGAVVAVQVPRSQPRDPRRHRGRSLDGPLAGAGHPSGHHGAHPQLRLGADEPGVGLRAVLVRPQPAAVRSRPDRSAGPRRHLLPGPGEDATRSVRAGGEPARAPMERRPRVAHRPARILLAPQAGARHRSPRAGAVH